MLISEKVIIAMPTKTGSRTMTMQPGDFEYRPPWHGVIPKPGITSAQDIVMMVREPHARLVSMWSYHQRNPDDWNISDEGKERLRRMSFTPFIRWLADQRNFAMAGDKNPLLRVGMDTGYRPWKWVLSLSEHEQCAKEAGYNVTPWRLEGLHTLPSYLKDKYDLNIGPFEKRLNDGSKWLGKDGERDDPKAFFTASSERLAAPWLRDGAVYGYGR